MDHPNVLSKQFHHCDFNDSSYKIVFHITACISFPIYGLALYVLFSNSTSYFKTYRILLLRHTFSNVLNDIISTILWLPRFHIPGMITCSHGILNQFNVFGAMGYLITFQFLILSLTQLFLHNLNVTMVQKSAFYKFGKIMKIGTILMHFLYLLNFISLVNAYDGFKNQNDYKKWIYETKNVSEIIFCDECFVPNFWSNSVKAFYIIGMINTVLATFLIFNIVFITYLSLRFSKQIKSSTTLSIQKNFLNALIVQTSGHIGCLSIPLSIFFIAVFYDLPPLPEYIYDSAYFISTQHGTLATIILLRTNKLLFGELKEKIRFGMNGNNVLFIEQGTGRSRTAQ